MTRILKTVVAVAALMGSTASFAAATVSFTPSGGPLLPGESIFASFDGGASTFGGAVAGGTGFIVQTGSNGSGADPAVSPTGDPYLAVLGGGSATFTFAGGLSQLAFDYGSADGYNSFLLTFADASTQSLNGNAIIASAANGNQTSPLTNGLVRFNAGSGPAITGLRLSSTQNSLEVDNFRVIGAVPEPGTWAMMLIGFGAVGYSMRRRTRGVLQAA